MTNGARIGVIFPHPQNVTKRVITEDESSRVWGEIATPIIPFTCLRSPSRGGHKIFYCQGIDEQS